MIGRFGLFLFEVAHEFWTEYRQERARRRAREVWATTPAKIRACTVCNEIAYTPGQVACNRCGGLLR